MLAGLTALHHLLPKHNSTLYFTFTAIHYLTPLAARLDDSAAALHACGGLGSNSKSHLGDQIGCGGTAPGVAHTFLSEPLWTSGWERIVLHHA
jgi:hypothetical protein